MLRKALLMDIHEIFWFSRRVTILPLTLLLLLTSSRPFLAACPITFPTFWAVDCNPWDLKHDFYLFHVRTEGKAKVSLGWMGFFFLTLVFLSLRLWSPVLSVLPFRLIHVSVESNQQIVT